MSEDYTRSLVTSRDPWVAYTLLEDEYSALSPRRQAACVYLPTLAEEVQQALRLPDISDRLLSTCQLIDVEDWQEASVDSMAPKARTTIDGVDYETDERYPYFCFVGANVIAQLWRSQDPLAFQVKDKNYPMERLAPEQLIHLNGVFHFDLQHSHEGHGFVGWLTPEHITIYNSYGGNVGFYIETYLKEDWVNFFLSFWSLPREEQDRRYHLLWGFTPDMTRFIRERGRGRQMVFESLSYAKIY